MKLWIVALVALVPMQQADEALKKETVYNSLMRFAMPRLPYGAHCDVIEREGKVTCFLSLPMDLDSARCASLKAVIDKGAKDGKIDAAAAGKALWPPIIESEIAGEYARLQKAIGVKGGELAFGGCIEFQWNKTDYCLLSKGSTKEWAFVSH